MYICVCDLSRGREGVFACVQACVKICVTFWEKNGYKEEEETIRQDNMGGCDYNQNTLHMYKI